MEIELYKRDGASYRRVEMTFLQDKVKVSTLDMGQMTKMIIGQESYEFSMTVDKADWGTLCAALITEYLGGDAEATDKLADLCARHAVPHDWTSKP